MVDCRRKSPARRRAVSDDSGILTPSEPHSHPLGAADPNRKLGKRFPVLLDIRGRQARSDRRPSATARRGLSTISRNLFLATTVTGPMALYRVHSTAGTSFNTREIRYDHDQAAIEQARRLHVAGIGAGFDLWEHRDWLARNPAPHVVLSVP